MTAFFTMINLLEVDVLILNAIHQGIHQIRHHLMVDYVLALPSPTRTLNSDVWEQSCYQKGGLREDGDDPCWQYHKK